MKKILTLIAALSLVASLAVGGSIAYLSDMDGKVNTMTMGNVEIQQNEYERVKDTNGNYTATLTNFTQNQTILPAIYGVYNDDNDYNNKTTYVIDGWQVQIRDQIKNYVDKIVNITNSGNTDAYVRTLIALPTGGWDSDSTASEEWLHSNVTTDDNSVTTPADNGWHWGPSLTSNSWPQSNVYKDVKIGGKMYHVFIATNVNKLAANKSTAPVMVGFYLDARVDYDHDAGVYTFTDSQGTKHKLTITSAEDLKILTLTQAVQAEGFNDAFSAFDAAYDNLDPTKISKWFEENVLNVKVVTDDTSMKDATENGEDIVLDDDVDTDADEETPYGKYKAGVVQKGGTIDGNGQTLSVTDDSYTYGIMTYGGTIKNIEVSGAERGIMIMNATEDIILDNVKILDCGYAFNTGDDTTSKDIDLVVKNSEIQGWSSFEGGLASATITDSKFGLGEYWQNKGWGIDYDRLIKPYINTYFNNCTFIKGYYIDLSALESGCKITLNNCWVEGTKITAGNYQNLLTAIELPQDGRTINDCVIFN